MSSGPVMGPANSCAHRHIGYPVSAPLLTLNLLQYPPSTPAVLQTRIAQVTIAEKGCRLWCACGRAPLYISECCYSVPSVTRLPSERSELSLGTDLEILYL